MPTLPLSFEARVEPKQSDNGRRFLPCFDMHLDTSTASEFLTDIGDELNGAPLRQLAGSDVA